MKKQTQQQRRKLTEEELEIASLAEMADVLETSDEVSDTMFKFKLRAPYSEALPLTQNSWPCEAD